MSRSSRGRTRSSTRSKNDGWDEWGGYMNAKIQKLENQFEKDASKSNVTKLSDIFTGVSIFVNGYTKPPNDTLKKLMQQHGGVYHHYYGRNKVTHIVATNLPNSKIAALTDQKVVKPEWITESIAAGRLLPCEEYLLYTNKSKVQPGLKSQFSSTKDNQNDQSVNKIDQQVIGHHQTNLSSAQCAHSTFDDDMEGVLVKSSAASSVEKLSLKDSSFENCEEQPQKPQGNEKEKVHENSEGVIRADKNLVMKSPAKAGDANFVAEFYSNSRLHHISTWGAEFKAYVSSLQAKLNDFPARRRLSEMAYEDDLHRNESGFGRVIMHIDMDCFFVSVGLRNKPHLKGKPVAVTHSKGHGAKTSPDGSSKDDFTSMAEIASCSYEARQCGVKNGMFMGPAKKLCPNLVPIPYDFDGYNEVSKLLYDCIASLTVDIEAVSCDELFVDCTNVLEETGSTPLQLATMMRKDIQEATKCTASAGLGPNMLIARLATRKAKPNGQCYITSEEVSHFMENQPIGNLPGIGRKLKYKFEELNITTCKELQSYTLSTLQKHFGPKTAETFYKYARGEDDRSIQSEKERKSVSAEINYGVRFEDWHQAKKFVTEVGEEVAKRLKAVNSTGKTITLKLKIRSADAPKETAKFLGHGICDSVSKAVTLPMATDNGDIIGKHAMSVLKTINPDVTDIRGLGIQVTRLERSVGEKSKLVPSILKYTCKQSEVSEQSKTAAITLVQSNNDAKVEPIENKYHVDNESNIGESEANTSLRLPPLPCLPDLMSPSPRLQKLAFQSKQGNTSLERTPYLPSSSSTNFMDVSSKGNVGKSDANYTSVFPSPSQIDNDVLQALPDEIRKEILAEQSKRSHKEQQQIQDTEYCKQLQYQEQNKRLRNDDENDEAGCSHWEDIVKKGASPSKFLNLETLKQAQSPSKSPGRGRGRGRGGNKVTSPRNVNNAGKFKVPQGEPPQRRSNPKKQLFAEDDERVRDGDSEKVLNVENVSLDNSTELAKDLIASGPPSLCGVTSLKDVKSLIKQWMTECQAPNEEDTVHFLTYLTELIEYKDLEQVLFITRHLLRQAQRSENTNWNIAVTEIIENIQVAVKSKYGSMLKIAVS